MRSHQQAQKRQRRLFFEPLEDRRLLAPIAAVDNYTIPEDLFPYLSVTAPGVLANDTGAVSVELTQQANIGTVEMKPDGSFKYTPTGDFSGQVTFAYKAIAADGTSATAGVTISVTPVNDSPQAFNNFYDVFPGNMLSIPAPGFLGNDWDADGDSLVVNDPAGVGATLQGNAGTNYGALIANADGSFLYFAPTSNFFLSRVSFTYRASDGEAVSNLATVTISFITPGAPPQEPTNYNSTVMEDVTFTIPSPGVLSGFLSFDNFSAALTGNILPASAGTVTLNSNGSFTFFPTPNFNGNASFAYRLTDGQFFTGTATVGINVTPVNDPPVVVNDSYTMAEETALFVSASAGVLINDTDVDGGSTLTAYLLDKAGLQGTLAGGLKANGGFTFVPSANFVGFTTFTYYASDGHSLSDFATVTINVVERPQFLEAHGDQFSMSEDGILGRDALSGVLANDDLFPTAHAIKVANPRYGTLAEFKTDGSFRYEPSANYYGPDSFTYKLRDGLFESDTATVTITVQSVNDAPEAFNDRYSGIAFGSSLSIGVPGILGNDIDVDGDTLTATVNLASLQGNTGTHFGVVTPNGNGGFFYTAPSMASNPALTAVSFMYQVNDGRGGVSEAATVRINIGLENRSPEAKGELYGAASNSALIINARGVLENDTDLDFDSLIALDYSQPAFGAGTLVGNSNGSFTFTPTKDFVGETTFTYRASDGQTQSSATVTINVTPFQEFIVPGHDAFSGPEDTTLVIDANHGVLANDSSMGGKQLVVDPLQTSLMNGTLNLKLDGSFTYVPHPHFNGIESFTYRPRINGGLASNSLGTVTIAVQPVNDAPNANADGPYFGNPDNSIVVPAPGLLTNDFDYEDDPLTAVLISQATNGRVVLGLSGGFTYEPAPFYIGQDSFTYRASDGSQASNTATVTVIINGHGAPPVFSRRDHYTAAVGGTLTIAAPGVLANDSDEEGNPLAVWSSTTPAHGILNRDSTGRFIYVPNQGFSGLDSFTYRANGGSIIGNDAVVTINVATPGNHAPTAVPEKYTVTKPFFTNVVANDVDVDGDTLTAELFTAPVHGKLSFYFGTVFVYVPTQDFVGPDSFTYRVSDGQSMSNVATVTINVAATNSPPVAESDYYRGRLGIVGNIQTLVVPTPAAHNLLANDTDIDGDTLAAVLISPLSPAASGVLNFNANGSFTIIPAVGFLGFASFSYKASDAQAESNPVVVTILITAAQFAPIATSDSYLGNAGATEDTTLVVNAASGVLKRAPGIDIDPDGDPLTAVLFSNAAHGNVTLNLNGSFTYVPEKDFSGIDSFFYRASDSLELSNHATVTIEVQPVNDPPVALNDQYNGLFAGTRSIGAPGILANDYDLDGEAFNVISHSPLSGNASGNLGILTVNANGSFTYVAPVNLLLTSVSFTYQISDGQSSPSTATVAIALTPPDHYLCAEPDEFTTTEDSSLVVESPGILANDIDAKFGILTAHRIAGPQHGALALKASGSFTYVPMADYHGTDSFTYKVTNNYGTESNTATVTINVQPVNDPPVANSDEYTAYLAVPLTLKLLANDTDADGEPLTYEILDGTRQGTLEVKEDGSLVYLSYFGSGPDHFVYRARDGQSASDATLVTIFVYQSSFWATSDYYDVPEDHTLTVSAAGLLANDNVRPADYYLPYVTDVSPTSSWGGVVSFQPDGSITYTPKTNFVGEDLFTYRIRSTNGNPTMDSTGTVTVTVLQVNDAPSFAKGVDLNVTDESPPQQIGGWAKGMSKGPLDEAGQQFGFLVTNSNNSLFLAQPAIDASGTLRFTPKPNVEGTATVTVKLKDDGGTANEGQDTSDAQTFTIAVKKQRVAHNVVMPRDSSGDGKVTVLDAVLVINLLNSAGPKTAPNIFQPGRPFYDVNGDGLFSTIDVVLILNYMHPGSANEAEGEASEPPPKAARAVEDAEGEAMLDLIAADAAWQMKPKRRK